VRLSIAQLDGACWRHPSNFGGFEFGLRGGQCTKASTMISARAGTDVVGAQSFKVAHARREPATGDTPGRDDCFGGVCVGETHIG
jgi:hypothetical protein